MKRGSNMFCPKCGAQVPDGSPFCSSCGAPMAQQTQQPMNQANNFGGNSNGFNPQDMVNDFKSNITDIKSFGIPQFVALGGAVVLLISMFLPYLKVTVFGLSKSANFFDGGALHWILGILIALCSAFLAVTKKGLNMLIAGGVAVLFFIFEWIFQFKDTLGVVSKGAGFYIMLLACLAIAVGGVLQFLQDKK